MNTTHKLSFLASASPASAARAWQSVPHPHLPIIATACSDKTIRIYSITSYTLLTTITGGHKRSVRCCSWKPSVKGKGDVILATGSFDATVAIWIAKEGVHTAGGGSRVQDLETNVNDDDDENQEEEYHFAVVLEGHDSEIKSIAWSAHGTYLATCSRDKSVWIWESLDDSGAAAAYGGGGGRSGFGMPSAEDEDNYETVAVLQEHEGDVKCVAWHPVEETCLASSSYDENVRVWREDADGEWGCVAVCEGHNGTVWGVAWEPFGQPSSEVNGDRMDPAADDGDGLESGPRLISCSDDFTIRVWRRKPKARAKLFTEARIPSIIRNTSDDEEWSQESELPRRHERAIYAVSWSPNTKRVVSCGSDGKLVVYEERPREARDTVMAYSTDANVMNGNHTAGGTETQDSPLTTEWVVLAQIEGAHGVFEVNHVTWATRHDREKGSNDEEIIISTGDDGEVKFWTVNGT